MKTNLNVLSRRDFTRTLAAAGTGVAFGNLRVHGANDRIRLGFIGLGNRGDQVLDAFLAQPDIEVAALCDLYQPYLDFAAGKSRSQPRRFKDYRRLLELNDVDAVVISTPDHWHALQMIEACAAGKDVYVEKPLSLSVVEGRRMVQAARKYQRVVQVGIHRRSSALCREAAQRVREGAIGKVTVARAFHIQNEWPPGIGNPPDEPAPGDWDWDAWLGPAPQVAYNRNRAFYRFRWFYDYSGGQLTNFGVHYLDFIHWALGQEAPQAVTAIGGKFAVEDNREIPDTLEVLWQYPGNTLVTFSQYNASAAPASAQPAEIELRGTRGTLYLFSDHYTIVPDAVPAEPFPARSPLDRGADRQYRASFHKLIEPSSGTGDTETAAHARDFLDAVRSRGRCSCDMETGHRSTSATLLGKIALKTRSLLEWDPQTEQFTNHPEANRHLAAPYRPPYKLPEV
jgi:predicted dehydrogenase